MATTAQIEANRRNAQKSTGPRTEAGKARAKLNAYKHGRRAKPVTPVLPQLDPAELEERIRRWVRDMKPGDAAERELVELAARTSLELDGLQRHEADRRSRRLEEARGRLDDEAAEQARDLGNRLLTMPEKRAAAEPRAPRDDDPQALLLRLEGSAEGCRWLLDRWAELRRVRDSKTYWSPVDSYRLIRLQGKRPVDAIYDPELNLQLLAFDLIGPGYAEPYWRHNYELASAGDRVYRASVKWREIAERPASEEAADAIIYGVIDGRIARLEEMLALYEEVAEEEAAAATFDPGPEAEGLRKRQSTLARELRQFIELILKMQAAREKRAARAGKTFTTEGTEGEDPGNGQGANEADPEDRGAEDLAVEEESGSAAEDTGQTHGADERSREAAADGASGQGAAGPHDRQCEDRPSTSPKSLVKADAGDETKTADGSPNRTDEAKLEMLKALVRQRLTEIRASTAADNRSQSAGSVASQPEIATERRYEPRTDGINHGRN